ncbi:MAG: hypothetical protein AAF621_05765 [Pseudomonadota bacterium]
MSDIHQEPSPRSLGEMLLQTMQEVRDEIKKLRQKDDDLWTAQRIAEYLSLSVKTVQGSTINQRDFPAPVAIRSPHSQGGSKRWIAGEVKLWAKKVKLHK